MVILCTISQSWYELRGYIKCRIMKDYFELLCEAILQLNNTNMELVKCQMGYAKVGPPYLLILLQKQ